VLNQAVTDFGGTLEITTTAANILQGSTITFDGGGVNIGNVKGDFTGVYDAANGDTIKLLGSTFVAKPGSLLSSILASGGNNRLEGIGNFTTPIVLENSSAGLTVALNNRLNQNITLNGGTLTLEKDLQFLAGKFPTGEGTIVSGGYTLGIGPGDTHLTSTWYMTGPTLLSLNKTTSLSGMIIFGPDDGESVIQGNGNILDLSLGGTLWVRAGHGMALNNLILTGLAPDKGTILFEDANSTCSLIRTVIKLDDTYSVTTGSVYCLGSDSLVITGDSSLIFDQNGTLSVDRVRFRYDTLNTPDQENISPKEADGVHHTSLNDGLVAPVAGTLQESNLIFDQASHILVQDYDLTPTQPLTFRGSGTSLPITLNGRGNFVRMGGKGSTAVAEVYSNKHAVFSDIVLSNFNPARFTRNSGSEITLGNETIIDLAGKSSLASTYICEGTVTINGRGGVLTLSSGGGFFLTSGSKLVLNDVVLKGLGGNSGSIVFADTTATLSAQSSMIELTADITFTTGNCYFYGGNSTFVTSDKVLTFDQNGTLTVDRTTLWYDPLSFGDGQNIQPRTADGLRHVLLNDGDVKLVEEAMVGGNLEYVAAQNSLSRSEAVMATRKLAFAAGGPSIMELDGNNYTVKLPAATTPVITVADNKIVKFKNIILQGFLPEHLSLGTNSQLIFDDKSYLLLGGHSTLGYTMTFSGTAHLDGGSRKLTLDDNGVLYIGDSSTLELNNVKIEGVKDDLTMRLDYDSLSFTGQTYSVPTGYTDDASLSVTSDKVVAWSNDGKYLAINTWVSGETHQLAVLPYDPSAQSFSFHATATADVLNNHSSSIEWSSDDAYLAVSGQQGASNTRDLSLYSFNKTTSTLSLSSSVTGGASTGFAKLSWRNGDGYISTGVIDDGGGNNAAVYSVSAGNLALVTTYTHAQKCYATAWSPDGNHLVAGFVQDAGSNELEIYTFSNNALALAAQDTFDSAHGGVSEVEWSPDGNYLAARTYPGGYLRVYHFNGTTKALTQLYDQQIVSSLGDWRYANEIAWTSDSQFLMTAITDTAQSALVADKALLGFHVDRRDNSVSEISNMRLAGSGGPHFYYGYAFNPVHSLHTFADRFTPGLRIERSLGLKESGLLTVKNPRIKAAGASANMALSGVTMVLDGNYSYSYGGWIIRGDSVVTNSWATFAYTSSSDFTINPNTCLTFEKGMTFSYDSVGGKSKIVMGDNTASICLNESTLHATGTGLLLTSGLVKIAGQSKMVSEGTDDAHALSISDNVDVFVGSKATLEFDGRVVYG
jgi:Tol biopolymer transport system component